MVWGLYRLAGLRGNVLLRGHGRCYPLKRQQQRQYYRDQISFLKPESDMTLASAPTNGTGTSKSAFVYFEIKPSDPYDPYSVEWRPLIGGLRRGCRGLCGK